MIGSSWRRDSIRWECAKANCRGRGLGESVPNEEVTHPSHPMKTRLNLLSSYRSEWRGYDSLEAVSCHRVLARHRRGGHHPVSTSSTPRRSCMGTVQARIHRQVFEKRPDLRLGCCAVVAAVDLKRKSSLDRIGRAGPTHSAQPARHLASRRPYLAENMSGACLPDAWSQRLDHDAVLPCPE